MYVSDVVLTNKNKENTEQKCKMRWESLVLDFWITVLCKLYEPTLRIKIHWQCVCGCFCAEKWILSQSDAFPMLLYLAQGLIVLLWVHNFSSFDKIPTALIEMLPPKKDRVSTGFYRWL